MVNIKNNDSAYEYKISRISIYYDDNTKDVEKISKRVYHIDNYRRWVKQNKELETKKKVVSVLFIYEILPVRILKI